MKKRYSVLLLLLFASAILVSQTGTIKVVKPIPPKATPPPPPPAPKQRFGIGFEIGTNYTFKGIDKVGFNAGVSFPIRHPFSIGLQYSYQDQYYRLSPFNTETLTSETSHSTSENKSQYLKMPITYFTQMTIGSMKRTHGRNFNLSFALAPEYLLSTSDQYGRLNYSKFRQYNLAGIISFDIPVRNRYSLNISYSKDFFENLKDRNLYGVTGAVVGKQKSKTNLISVSLSTYITR